MNNSLQLTVRWAARISSLIFTGVFLLMFIGEGFEPAEVKPIEWVMLFFGPFGLVAGMILAWWKEGLGGAVILLSFLASMVVGDYSGSGAGVMLVCASPGFLFLLSWILSRSAEMSKGISASGDDIPQPPSAETPEARQARNASGMCPKCGAPVTPTDKNCPSCRANLEFAETHLDQL